MDVNLFISITFCAQSFPKTKQNSSFQYQGVWYEISKIPIASEGKGTCGQAEYTLNGDVVIVKNSHVIDGERKFIEGTAKFAADANEAAKFVVSFKFGGKILLSDFCQIYHHFS